MIEPLRAIWKALPRRSDVFKEVMEIVKNSPNHAQSEITETSIIANNVLTRMFVNSVLVGAVHEISSAYRKLRSLRVYLLFIIACIRFVGSSWR